MNTYNISRICLGVFYLIASMVNLFHTINNTQYLWVVCLENVHFSSYKEFLEQIIIPNEKSVIILIVFFELVVGMLILSKEIFVKIGLMLGVLWVLLISPFLPWNDILGHLILGIFQALLLKENYDKSFLEIIHSKILSDSIL
ncbi:MAG: hypothetical protein ACFFB2_16140 [Promethearchaeota archaeon]